MYQQIGELRHQDAVISIYRKGIVVSSKDCEQIYIGEELVKSIDILTSFLELEHEGLAEKIGGEVRGDEGAECSQSLWIHHLFNDVFSLSNDDDEADVLKISRSFIELLRSSAVYWRFDAEVNPDELTEEWTIYGSIPWEPDFHFTINSSHFEVIVKDEVGNLAVFHTERGDRELWFRSIVLAELMLKRNCSDGTWQIVRVDGNEKRMRLELQGERVLFSIHDPSMTQVGISINLDLESMLAFRIIFNQAWVYFEEIDDEEDEEFAEFDDDDDEEEGVS